MRNIFYPTFLSTGFLLRPWAWLGVCCLGLVPTAAWGQDQPKVNVPAGVVYEPNLEYGKGGAVSLKLDLARPEKLDKRVPCIVVIHGGGWRAGEGNEASGQEALGRALS